MEDFVSAIGLALALEGAAYALFPDGMRRLMSEVLAMPTPSLRTAALAAIALGLGLLWLVRG